MAKYSFLVEVEYSGDEPYTDEIEDALKSAYPQANFRVQKAAQHGARRIGCTCTIYEDNRIDIDPSCQDHGEWAANR